ncbi:unnamed protein product [Vitrella brassicaformis CCMP3155]|uniref:Acyltransferase n=2 Tax=Vitrella brassicaformis TaxID=1169539 RepID=A0A0G4EU08_VITBC|nr:unnamed protein product [Vitrella brassicaformis CCMP3155]|mmetsp:Transcript_10087/g.24462  ORF Transcript_10087/g.24462 Transcript_10087/m.24462 type:complete len:368 (+) Transcript_10087:95-1198(+)|eukprot:CEM01553.1 unnamed protein product [Vitrella brassicaformis CCMP3155]
MSSDSEAFPLILPRPPLHKPPRPPLISRLCVYDLPVAVDGEQLITDPSLLRKIQSSIPSPSVSEELKALCVAFAVVGSFLYVPIVLVWVYRRYCKTRWQKAALLAGLLLVCLVPVRQRPFIRFLGAWRTLLRYLTVVVAFEEPEKVPLQESVIMPVVPHGVFPVGQAFLKTHDMNALLRWPRMVVASSGFRFPIFKQLIELSNCVPAALNKMTAALRDGSSLALTPGGIAEIYEADDTHESVIISRRKGFTRLAMQSGRGILPVYIFGNTSTFKQLPISKFLRPLARLTRAAVSLYYGRFGLRVPFRTPLLYVVGREIDTRQYRQSGKPITEEDVACVHELVIDELVRIFEKYKDVYGWGYKKLVVK